MAKDILPKENIMLNSGVTTKEQAITAAGEILVKQGYVEDSYIEKMFEREEVTSTYMGNYIAIPHGSEDSKEEVLHSGMSIVRVPEGIDYGGGNEVKLLFGIAGKNNEHLEILSKVAIVCSDMDNIEKMLQAESAEELLDMFSEVS
ncbi:PTS sugar transporter subunit IIA [Salisediminibacterium halotolerans]|uniref:PTS sugar transporter subunit IIA n=1 Tax=Salisediminibacterium halotolerans TaxID=517425 RepID=UPI000EADA0A7|nr:PTS sugar transporter subunit IIA [Salisediminibacterium halotolerans]RLJ73190.1 PTS system D-mannitol-specific IIA component (Fru family) [Actinophytocola xinjiangensis]RPE86612.1 PTS system D-mannitol-specific IIA component (Fru family) [Salisediminibacterium halotolerans]TWG33987.1 PTS system D-mannitol-specific IIA component (Fru family) [Salisediminibacterium halotolerans]GEL06606.1 mannitol-specific phosphotransferase enzyme IIA component [Salisediminibacterium halotolerans]